MAQVLPPISGETVDYGPELLAYLESLCPIGVVKAYAGTTAPDGWLLCDGSLLDNSAGEYDNLYAVIGTVFGGTDQTSFNVPDLKGRVPIGVGQGSTYANGVDAAGTNFALGDADGKEKHKLIIDEMPAHTHTINLSGAQDSTSRKEPLGRNADAAGTDTTRSTGGDAAHNNLQPYLALNYIIKY